MQLMTLQGSMLCLLRMQFKKFKLQVFAARLGIQQNSQCVWTVAPEADTIIKAIR